MMRILAAALSLLALAAPAAAQRARKPVCTVCRNDAGLLAQNGLSHGPFAFGRNDTQTIEREFFFTPIWIETPHFRLGLDLDDWKIPENERKAYRAELEQLREHWPRVRPRRATMDRWLRAHLLAFRVEQLYQEFLDLAGSSSADFQAEEFLHRYGLGPYLGMKDKFEVMVFKRRGPYREYMSTTWGLTYLKPQRWNNVDRGCLWFGLNQEEDEIRHDKHLYSYVRHNLAHNLLDGYFFYGFDLPVWITEGFAHWIAREKDIRFNMFDSIEGAFQQSRPLQRWEPAVRRIVQKGDAASFAQLLRRKSFAEIAFDDHLVVWSKMDFLIRHDREKFARFLRALKWRRDASGAPDGSGLDAAQRDAFKEIYGWSLLQAEQAWQEWVLETYPFK